MSVRALRTDVYLAVKPGEIPTRFLAGTPADELPAGVADAISNPGAWIEFDEVIEADPVEDLSQVDPVEVVEQDDPDGDDEQLVAGGLVEPPRGGRGSTDEAWREFAAGLGQPVADNATRSEVIAQLSDAGLIDAEG